MRTVLFGGTDLTLAVAERFAAHIAGVVTIPPTFRISYEPAGVRNLRHADVSGWADSQGIPAHEWTSADDVLPFLETIGAEWGLAAGWYYMLPRRILDRFPLGIAGVHASLLPRLRGNAPLNWAILSGTPQTGVSLFQLTDELDNGPLYGQKPLRIDPHTTIGDLVAGANTAALELIGDAIAAHESPDGAQLLRQNGQVSYGLARLPSDSRIDWRLDALSVARLVRASSRPYAGAFTYLDEQTVRIWSGQMSGKRVSGTPGQIWLPPYGELVVVCGDHSYEVIEATFDDGEDALPALRKASMRRFDQPAAPTGSTMGWPTFG